MSEHDTIYATRPSPAATKILPLRTRAEKRCAKAVVLDMGEASREQGFLLNGCR